MRLAFFSSPANSLSPLRGLPLISFAKKNQEKPLGQGYWDRNVLSKFYIFHYSNVVNFWSFFSLFLSFVHQNRAVNHSWSVWIDISLAKEAPFQPSIYIGLISSNVAIRFSPVAGRIPAPDQCIVQKSRGGLVSWSAQLDSPGTTLTVGGWIRPGGQN